MTGSLQTKGNKYYVVARIPDASGKTKAKWIATGIEVKGNNKREAQRAMQRILSSLENQKATYSQEMLFVLWLDKWMEQKRQELRLNTWECYHLYLNKHIRPFFFPRKLTLSKLSPQNLQDYYNLKLREGQSVNTLKKHHAILHGSLQEAYKKGLIPFNPADRVTFPKQSQKPRFHGSTYTVEQIPLPFSIP